MLVWPLPACWCLSGCPLHCKRHPEPQGISWRINFALLSAQCTWKYDLCEGIDMLIQTSNSSAYEQIQLNCFIIAGKKLSSLHCPRCPPTAECHSCLDTQTDCMSILSEWFWREGCVCACLCMCHTSDLEVCFSISCPTHLDQISTALKNVLQRCLQVTLFVKWLTPRSCPYIMIYVFI